MGFFTRNVGWAFAVFAVANYALYNKDGLKTAKKKDNEALFKELEGTGKAQYASLKEAWKKAGE